MIKRSIILVSLLSVRIWIPSLSTIKSQTANTINNPLNSLVLFWFWLTVTTFQLSNYLHHERVLDFITYACGSDRYFGDINCILCTINNKRSKSKFSTNETCAHPGLSDNATHCKTTNITTNRWNICFYICWPFFFFFFADLALFIFENSLNSASFAQHTQHAQTWLQSRSRAFSVFKIAVLQTADQVLKVEVLRRKDFLLESTSFPGCLLLLVWKSTRENWEGHCIGVTVVGWQSCQCKTQIADYCFHQANEYETTIVPWFSNPKNNSPQSVRSLHFTLPRWQSPYFERGEGFGHSGSIHS